MKKYKILYTLVIFGGIFSLFLPWLIINDGQKIIYGFSSILPFFQNPVGVLLFNAYILGLIISLIFIFRGYNNSKWSITGALLMLLGVFMDFLAFQIAGFGGDVQVTSIYGTGFWLALWAGLVSFILALFFL